MKTIWNSTEKQDLQWKALKDNCEAGKCVSILDSLKFGLILPDYLIYQREICVDLSCSELKKSTVSALTHRNSSRLLESPREKIFFWDQFSFSSQTPYRLWQKLNLWQQCGTAKLFGLCAFLYSFADHENPPKYHRIAFCFVCNNSSCWDQFDYYIKLWLLPYRKSKLG